MEEQIITKTKICKDCGIDKLFSMFNKNPDGKFGLRSNCIECKSKKQRNKYKENGKDFYSKKAKNYLNSNEDARKRARLRNQEWRKKNLDYDAFRSSMRRKVVKQATPMWADIESIKFVYKKAKEYGFQVDHVVPLKSELVCGLNIPENMQLLHKSINTSKGNRWWPDMPEGAL